jgi:hypothetical protein
MQRPIGTEKAVGRSTAAVQKKEPPEFLQKRRQIWGGVGICMDAVLNRSLSMCNSFHGR